MADALTAGFSDEQLALRDVASDLFDKVNPPSRIRELSDGRRRDRDVWHQLAQVGLTAIGVPEEHGGLGGDARDLVLVLEQAGRTCLPEPLVETVATVVPTLVAAGGDTAATWLPRLAVGEATATVWFEDTPFVADADDADVTVVEQDGELFLVERGGLTDLRQVTTEDGTRRLFRAEPDLSGAVRLGGADLADEAATRLVGAVSAVLVGVCQRLLDESVAYAKVRRQFDVPIGSFQAVQHKLASMFVAVESARGAVRHGARRIALGADDATHAARVAKAAAGEASRLVNAEALQIHGGIGFTWEHDLHLWLKRGLALETAHGDTRTQRRMIAGDLLV